MWTSFSARRWICLLTLAVVMLVSASQVDSSFPSPGHDCCHGGQTRKVKGIKTCYKQDYRRRCPYDAFLIGSSTSIKPICVQKGAQWLQNLLDEDKLTCPSQFSAYGRFKVLDDEDEDDVEW